MEINELQHIYAAHPNSGALAAQLQDKAVKTLFLSGLHASAAPLFFSAYLQKAEQTTVFILNDLEEAGYFYSCKEYHFFGKKTIGFAEIFGGDGKVSERTIPVVKKQAVGVAVPCGQDCALLGTPRQKKIPDHPGDRGDICLFRSVCFRTGPRLRS